MCSRRRLTVEQLHHQKWMARRFAHVVNHANIGMIQRRSGARLALETLSRRLRCKGLWQNFDGYFAMKPRVARLIHLAHSALADQRKDFVGAEFVADRKGHNVTESIAVGHPYLEQLSAEQERHCSTLA